MNIHYNYRVNNKSKRLEDFIPQAEKVAGNNVALQMLALVVIIENAARCIISARVEYLRRKVGI